jgi:ADP-heptose:LPS heptosyltransferase
MAKTAIFHIEGGIGKHIAATAVLQCYKNQNPNKEIIVVCAWPDVFYRNKCIDRVFRIGNTQYFYKDYILNKDVEIFAQEPYKQTSHLTKQKHLIETWCDLIGVNYNKEQPTLYLNFRESEYSKRVVSFTDNKPILIFQPFGGPEHTNPSAKYSWARDIHPAIAQQLVDRLAVKYNIIHICCDHHPDLNNCTRLSQQLSKKVLFGMLATADKRLLIDSSLQHAAAALNLPSTVVWGITDPYIFGYDIHNNITPEISYPEGTSSSYLFDYNIHGDISECPYTIPNFNIGSIIEILEK